MAKKKPWTEEENNLLLEMIGKGATLEDIIKSRSFSSRTPSAIQMQLSRLGSVVKQKEKTLVKQISEAEIVGLESIVKRFVDAFNKICDLTECSKEDLERFRIIFAAARVYFDIYFKLQKFEEVEVRVERVEKLVEQLATAKKTEASG